MEIILSDKVLFNELDNEVVLLHLESGEYFGLNEIGADFWQSAQSQSQVDDIIESLLSMYDVDKQTLEKDIHELITQLSDAQLLTIK